MPLGSGSASQPSDHLTTLVSFRAARSAEDRSKCLDFAQQRKAALPGQEAVADAVGFESALQHLPNGYGMEHGKKVDGKSAVTWHPVSISRTEHQVRNGHPAAVIWFTGLSGSGKSTLAHALEKWLFDHGCQTCVLDGDNIRHGLCSDLDFSDDGRKENIRRIGEVAKLMTESGLIAITAFISPFREDRERVRAMMPHGDFLEIYLSCSLDVCESRDVKGLYRRARAGEIPFYTGISSPFEPPERPELVLDTANQTVEECLDLLILLVKSRLGETRLALK